MRWSQVIVVACALFLPSFASEPAPAAEDEVPKLQKAFLDYSGGQLVFEAADLPKGEYHDIMTPLSANRRVAAGRIAVREVQKLPPGYLRAIGLKSVGVFAVCGSKSGDGFRPYDATIKGYRYYGIWNGKNALAAAYYSDEQLPLTIHHEIFHHVDATLKGRIDGERITDDARFSEVLAGKNRYPAATLPADDLAALKKASSGSVLEGAVSEYSRKSIGEDKAETARYLMSHLPDALVQVATRPNLPGSQRMLHILHKYEQAPAENGPGLAWFVDVARGKQPMEARAEPIADKGTDATAIIRRLQRLAAAGASEEEVREALRQAEALAPGTVPAEEAVPTAKAALRLADQLLRTMIHPSDSDRRFDIRGHEDANAANMTLRSDLREIGQQCAALQKMSALAPAAADDVTAAQLRGLRLLARYQRFIASQWDITDGTRRAFEKARDDILASLPKASAEAIKERTALEWARLAERIASDGTLTTTPAVPENPYLAKVDAAISDVKVRAAIRQAQPACIRLDNGSGVNIAAEGVILTAGHCTNGVGSKVNARFPDGRSYVAVCTAFDAHLDLAVCVIRGGKDLPFARIAAAAPKVSDWVACIGQPGELTPKGEATGYKPFHVSTGHIRGFLDNPLGDQSLGRTKHDAWTYWGHSGSPLFNAQGAIVALHNSWDSTTAMRHAVTHQAIVEFLTREKIAFTSAK